MKKIQETVSENLGSSGSTASDTKNYSNKKVSKKSSSHSDLIEVEHFPSIKGSRAQTKRGSFKDRYQNDQVCEQIVEVEDDDVRNCNNESGATRRVRWIHPQILLDAEDKQLGLNKSNIQFNIGFNVGGRSKSSDLIRMPKIVEGPIEDDVNIIV